MGKKLKGKRETRDVLLMLNDNVRKKFSRIEQLSVNKTEQES